MIPRALAVWSLLLVLAVLNGGVREAWLTPRFGESVGRALSSVLLALLILLATWATMRWIGIRTAGAALTVGAMWVGLTLLFEFGAGHYAFGKPWAELLADYDLSRGRIWIVVLIATFAAPLLALRLRP